MKKKPLIMGICILGLLLLTIIGVVICFNIAEDKKNTDYWEELVGDDDKDKDGEDEKDEPETEVVQSENTEADVLLQEALLLALAETDADPVAALALFEQAAELGNTDALYFAGEMYLQGIGADRDTKKAASYFQQAFEKGNKNAFGIYAKFCFLGDGGIYQDYEKAAAIFSLIADEDAEAAYMLGVMHTFGMGVPANFEKAVAYLEQAEEAGYAQAANFRSKLDNWPLDAQVGEAALQTEGIQIVQIQYEESLQKQITEYVAVLRQSEQYDNFIQEQTALANMDVGTSTTVALYGKDNWIYLQNPNDGDSLHDYIGDNAYTEEEMATIAQHLLEQKTAIEEKGSEFVLLIIPNKEVIYPENMPTYIERVSEVTKTDKLVEYLRANTDITIAYAKDSYNKYKDDYLLYYKTDTHCNMQGSFVALAEFLNVRYNKQIGMEGTHFDVHMNNYCGDIAVMLGRADRYSRETVYFLPETSVPAEDKVDESLLLIGDSFSEFLNTQAGYYFNGGVNHLMVMNYSYDFYLATENALKGDTVPDVVVWECVERYIDRLK